MRAPGFGKSLKRQDRGFACERVNEPLEVTCHGQLAQHLSLRERSLHVGSSSGEAKRRQPHVPVVRSFLRCLLLPRPRLKIWLVQGCGSRSQRFCHSFLLRGNAEKCLDHLLFLLLSMTLLLLTIFLFFFAFVWLMRGQWRVD